MTLRSVPGVAVCCIAAATFGPSLLWASTIHVSPGEQLGTALATAAAGDTVLVQCGTYTEQGLQMVDGVTLRSENGDPACVTIATSGGESILTCETLYTTTRIEGITFTAAVGGMLPAPRGAALLIVNASPLVSHCVFTDLLAGYGGAIYCGSDAAPAFVDCSFTNNQALAVGGALNCIGTSAPVLANCLLANNSAAGGAHALNVAGGAALRLVNSTLADNESLSGQTLRSWDAGAITMDNCIVSGDAWIGDTSAVPTIACSDLYLDRGDAWTGLLAAQSNQAGNIAADPLFCADAAAVGLPYALDESSPCTAAATAGCGRMGAFVVGCAVSGVGDDTDLQSRNIPLATRLRGNYPNPFNPSTTILYDLKQSGPVEISIYDLAGRRVRRLVSAHLPAGTHEVQWNGTDTDERPVAAGVYFIRLKTPGALDKSRISLVK